MQSYKWIPTYRVDLKILLCQINLGSEFVQLLMYLIWWPEYIDGSYGYLMVQ